MSHEPYSSVPQAGAPWAPPAPSSRLLPVLGVVLGLLGLVVGTAAWFRAAPAYSDAPPFSEQQVTDAKKAVCEAYVKGWHSLQVAGSRKKPDDPTDTIPVVSVNGRVAETAVGNYLVNSAEANPAAPEELKGLIRHLGQAYQEIVLSQLADGSKSDVAPIADEADRLREEIEAICR